MKTFELVETAELSAFFLGSNFVQRVTLRWREQLEPALFQSLCKLQTKTGYVAFVANQRVFVPCILSDSASNAVDCLLSCCYVRYICWKEHMQDNFVACLPLSVGFLPGAVFPCNILDHRGIDEQVFEPLWIPFQLTRRIHVQQFLPRSLQLPGPYWTLWTYGTTAIQS
jgi:hypothetical protein